MPRSNDDASSQGIFGGHGTGILLGIGGGAVANHTANHMIRKKVNSTDAGRAMWQDYKDATAEWTTKLHNGEYKSLKESLAANKEASAIQKRAYAEHGGRLGKIYAHGHGLTAGFGALAAGALIGGALDRD